MSAVEEALPDLGEVEVIVRDPLRFKARLEIGEEAYTMLTVRNRTAEFLEFLSAGVGGAKLAGSAAVASTFFTTSAGGVLGFFGATTAVTPIGWIIAAGIASGGAYHGVRRMLRNMDSGRVEIVPKFINTPLDVLALSLFDFLAPLALKVAAADGTVTEDERRVIKSYFVEEWGYDEVFASQTLQLREGELDELPLEVLIAELRGFLLQNRDCNHKKVAAKVISLLKEIAEADGQVHPNEQAAIDQAETQLLSRAWTTWPFSGGMS